MGHVRRLTKKNIVKNDWKTTFKEYYTWAFVVINSNHFSEITGKWHEYVQVSFQAWYCIEYFVNLLFFSLESYPYAFQPTTIVFGQFAVQCDHSYLRIRRQFKQSDLESRYRQKENVGFKLKLANNPKTFL